MNRLALWSVALLLVGLGGASLVEEVLVRNPRQDLFVPGLFATLSLLAAVGLVLRVKIARPVASALYLLTALGVVFEVVIAGTIAFQTDSLDFCLFVRFALGAFALVLIVIFLWWLTKRSTIAAFQYGVQA